jgi:SAM-dependent methyltransferase
MATEKNTSPVYGTIKNFLNRLPLNNSTPNKTTVSQAVPLIPKHKRFLTDNPMAYKNAIDAAESYVSKLEPGEIGWLHSKPYDPTLGNPQYFRLMFDLLNILQTMKMPVHARILEIGSGPGWVTEILLMMGFSVDAIEPSADLIAIAQERCSGLTTHYRHPAPPKVRFHQTTLEEIELDDRCFDAILFFDVLHHVVNEEIAFEKSFRFLKPGGCLGIAEGAWHPDFKTLEQALILEMAKFGTLENPFSAEYIDYLLTKSGFIGIERYVGVNGFFSQNQLSQPLRNFSAGPLAGSNNMIARKPDNNGHYPSCTDFNFKTDAQIKILSGGIDIAARTAFLVIDISNTGETLFDNQAAQIGHITLALRQGVPGTRLFLEAKERHLLTKTLIPGGTVGMELTYTLPPCVSLENWELDMVAEGVFWFSCRGIHSCPVPCL